MKNSKMFMGNSDAMLEQFATDQSTTAGKKVESGPRWTDENIRKLIQLWSEKPALYDTKHDSYFSKNKRREALDQIIEEMGMSEKDIQQKMVSLRTYYGSQQRKKIAWESDPTKTTSFKSRWQFWIPLDFLQDHMTQKQSDTKMQDEECLSPEFCEDSPPEKGTVWGRGNGEGAAFLPTRPTFIQDAPLCLRYTHSHDQHPLRCIFIKSKTKKYPRNSSFRKVASSVVIGGNDSSLPLDYPGYQSLKWYHWTTNEYSKFLQKGFQGVSLNVL